MSAPFRITKKAIRPVSRQSGEALKDYLERLTKLIPSEIIGLYLVGKGIVAEDQSLLMYWTIFCLFGVVVSRIAGTTDVQRNLPPQISAVVISVISYTIWIYSMGDIFKTFGIHFPKVGSLLVLGWTFIVPYIYQGTSD